MQRRFKRKYRRMQEFIKMVELHQQSAAVSADEKTSSRDCEPPAADDEPTRNNPFMDQLFCIVDEVMTTGEYSVSHIAATMNMSKRTFARRLKEATNQSPKMFLSAIQMERCAKLIVEHPEMTISEVSYKCGFEEASSFSHAFKRIYGCSPSAYRERNKRETK